MVANSTVQIDNLNTNFKKTIVTDITGIAEFTNITEGRYQITVQASLPLFPPFYKLNFILFITIEKSTN